MRFPPDFLDDLRSRVALSRVIGNATKLKRQGRELVGLCPFHQEKTPSFSVSDTKGVYHCHGCGQGGDAVSWLQARRGLSFGEAVAALAALAGVTLPSPGPEAVRREARRLGQIQENEREQSIYQAGLAKSLKAQAFLGARGITAAMVAAFGLGWATGGPFQSRITIPIHDAQGRHVGYGARATGDAKPKYLNSEASEAFDKGRLLYNAHRVRQACHDGAQLHVVEGYFDAISCTNAGLQAVATMGTAITEAQLLGLWRLNPEPVLLLDGDAAGRAAAARAVSVALPLLLPGRSMRVCLLPPGMDPDDIIRHRGAATLRAAVGASLTLPSVWWLLGSQNASLLDARHRAAIETRLIDPLQAIPDPALRRQWIQDVRERLKASSALKPVFRANGHTGHSTNPGSVRMVHAIETTAGFSLREAALITAVLHRAGAVTEAELAVRGLSERTQAVLQEISQLAGSVPTGGLREAVDEAYGVVHGAGIRALG